MVLLLQDYLANAKRNARVMSRAISGSNPPFKRMSAKHFRFLKSHALRIDLVLTLLMFLNVLSGCRRTVEVDPDGSIEATVVNVVDGDTIDIRLADKTQQRVRLDGVDCPETRGDGGQPFSRQAKELASRLCLGKQVKVVQTGKHYDRWVAFVLLPNGEFLQHELLKNGLAWHASKYSDDQEMRSLEQAARREKVGLWSDADAVEPTAWRNGERGKQDFGLPRWLIGIAGIIAAMLIAKLTGRRVTR